MKAWCCRFAVFVNTKVNYSLNVAYFPRDHPKQIIFLCYASSAGSTTK